MATKQLQEQDNELKKQLIEYEKMYKELNIKLHKSQSHVIENERELLACLQKTNAFTKYISQKYHSRFTGPGQAKINLAMHLIKLY